MANSMYKPLDTQNHEIRILVLDLEASPQSIEDWGLTAALEHVSLIDTEAYIALSYCWGEQTAQRDQDHIYIGWEESSGLHATKFNITANLRSSLLALQSRELGNKKSLRLWVDAICINQQDPYERSQQIQRMQQIYSRAAEVIARIGPFGDKHISPKSIKYLSRIPSIAARGGSDRETMVPASSKFSVGEMEAFRDLFNEPYWKRSWIIQEITVASKVRILYADLEFSWDEVAAVLSMLNSLSHHEETTSSHQHLGPSHLLKFREHYMDDNKPITLFQALTWTLHTKATDPRDKIFALLGLCHDGFKLVPVPNYKQTLESIIVEMSKVMLSRLRNLELVCLRGIGRERNGLPTWVPNWPSLWAGKLMFREKHYMETQMPFSFNPVFGNDGDTMINVEAIRVSQILGLSSSVASASTKAHSPSPFTTQERIQSLSLDILNYCLRKRRTIWRTLTCSYLEPRMYSSNAHDCFSMLWTPYGRGSIRNTSLIDWIDQNAQFQIGEWTLSEWSQISSSRLSGSEVSDDEIRRIMSAHPPWSAAMMISDLCIKTLPMGENKSGEISPASHWKSVNRALEKALGTGSVLAEIESHRRNDEAGLALVHPNAETNDEIFFLRGCRCPVVLRKHSTVPNVFNVVGYAWIDLSSIRLQRYDSWAIGNGALGRNDNYQKLWLI